MEENKDQESAEPIKETDSKPASDDASTLAAGITLGQEGAGGRLASEGEASEAEPEEVKIDPTGRIVEPDSKKYHWGTGRRKASVARVRIRPGSGEFVVNDREMKHFFTRIVDQNIILGPLRSIQVEKKVDVFVSVFGGGITGQSGAVRLGLGRSLIQMYPDAYQTLRENGHLTRDPRMVERKKYGLRGARRAFQWVKR